jgi:hypothetical protein
MPQPELPASMRHNLRRYLIVAILNPRYGVGCVVQCKPGSRTARRLVDMGCEVTSTGSGRVLVRSRLTQ